MRYKIMLDCPNFEALESLLEEMADDQFVGSLEPNNRIEWLFRHRKIVNQRFEEDHPSTVIYQGSTVVGVAFSAAVKNEQAEAANLVPDNDYWKLGNFYIAKEFRGLGLGKAALKFFLDAKDGKVAYFADVDNTASNAVAKACGLTHTHDYLQNKNNHDIIATKIGIRVRTPCWINNVYFGTLPEPSMLLEPTIMSYLQN